MRPAPAPTQELPAPPRAAWVRLRASLAGDERRGPSDSGAPSARAVAHAAVLGGVVELTATRAPWLAPALAPFREALARWDMGLQLATGEVARALAAVGIPAALLKGGASAWLLYERPNQRERRDVDVLVSPAHFHRAVEALAALPAWRPVPGRAWWARAGVGHEWAASRALGAATIECDLHRRLALPRHLNIDHAAILGRARRPPGAPMALVSLEDLALHTALHAAGNGLRVPLRTWWDLRAALSSPTLNVPALVRRARRWGVGTALWVGAVVVERWFGVARRPILEALAPPPSARRLLDALLRGQGATPLTWDGPVSRRLVKALALGDGRARGGAALAAEYARLAWAGAAHPGGCS